MWPLYLYPSSTELAELPLVRLDVSCNRISHVPVCYRHLRHLQLISLDNNPLQMPPAQICSKGKFHIFKYLNMEACKRSQDQLERALRPSGFSSWWGQGMSGRGKKQMWMKEMRFWWCQGKNNLITEACLLIDGGEFICSPLKIH